MTDFYAHTGQVPPPKRPSRRPLLIGLAIAAAALVCAGAGVVLLVSNTGIIDALSPGRTITGTVTLELDDMINNGTTCFGERGFADIKVGAPVVVTDAAGKTVGTGAIGSAKEIGGRCVLSFTVDDVPAGPDFYGVTVSHRGTVTYSADEVDQPLALTLG